MKQDRLAHKIATQYGKTAKHEVARKGGTSPLEALGDWDLLDVEARKKLNNNKLY